MEAAAAERVEGERRDARAAAERGLAAALERAAEPGSAALLRAALAAAGRTRIPAAALAPARAAYDAAAARDAEAGWRTLQREAAAEAGAEPPLLARSFSLLKGGV